MTSVQIKRANTLKSRPWGLGPDGETTELAISPEGDFAKRDFRWRLSTATIRVARSEFTVLQHHDHDQGIHISRQLLLLQGKIRLRQQNGPWTQLEPGDITGFSGSEKTQCEVLTKEPVVDLNLMLAGNVQGTLSYEVTLPGNNTLLDLTQIKQQSFAELDLYHAFFFCPPDTDEFVITFPQISLERVLLKSGDLLQVRGSRKQPNLLYQISHTVHLPSALLFLS